MVQGNTQPTGWGREPCQPRGSRLGDSQNVGLETEPSFLMQTNDLSWNGKAGGTAGWRRRFGQ